MDNDPTTARVDLYWLPLGAGTHCVRWSGRAYEALEAAFQQRGRGDLYHAALEVGLDGDCYVVEMAPAWDRAWPGRGVAAEGPVGLAWLGRSQWFRYEVRRWRNGVIPDVAFAVDSFCQVPTNHEHAARLLQLVDEFPTLTWGRDQLRTGDMWNSNSLVAWLLARSGHDTTAMSMPANGRAPGWTAGLVAAGDPDPPVVSGAARPRSIAHQG